MEREQQHWVPLRRAVANASCEGTTVPSPEPAHCAPEVRADSGKSRQHDQRDASQGRAGAIFDQVTSFEGLYRAYRRARREKRYQPEVLRFSSRLELELLALQREIRGRSYAARPFRSLQVFDPKPRQILAPAFRDRVVHHALCAVIEPACERRFICDSYACRSGKGSHSAVRRLQQFLRRCPQSRPTGWVLKADIARYFPSIRHDLLIQQMRRIVRDEGVFWLIERVLADSAGAVDPGRRGLPIGALTSQLFANVYLDPLDHWIKEVCRERWYVRYMDDFLIVSQDKKHLREMLAAVHAFLAGWGLSLNPKTAIVPAGRGIPFVGYRVWPGHIRVLQPSLRRMRRRLRELQRRFALGQIGVPEIRQRIMSWLGHIRHADSASTCAGILGDVGFTRGG